MSRMSHNPFDPFEFKSADAHATFDDLPNKAAEVKAAMAVTKSVPFEFQRLSPDSVVVKLGGVEISISVNEPDPADAMPCSEVLVDVKVPGELDPTVFKINEECGIVTMALARAGRVFSYKDLYPHNT